MERSVGAEHDPHLAKSIRDVRRLRACRLECRAIAHELDPEKETRPADVADNGMTVHERPKGVEQPPSDPECVRLFLDESRLDPQRQAQLATLFARMTADIDDEHEYRLEMRDSKALGANAFALPSGIVLVTDDIVALAGSDEELMAVLAHEIGHVRGRHALRQMIQAAGISVIAVVLLGDVSSVSALASSAPVLLQAKNSREFEREADVFARDWLRRQGIPPRRFDDMLCRLVAKAGGDAVGIDKFLASHPPVSERAECNLKEVK